MLTVLFFAKHLALFLLMLVTAASAGTLALGAREPLPLRAALGLALWGELSFGLAALGWLRPWPLLVMAVVTIAGGAWRGAFSMKFHPAWIAALIPSFLLALHPPLAFDETLYRLPFVHSLATTGSLGFLEHLRFPVFPKMHELLCVPAMLLAGDQATHLVSLVEVLVTVALVATWARRHVPDAGPLAAALFIGSPIVIHLASILYAEAALMLFVGAGFYALDVAVTESRRMPLVLSGLFLGVACSVKYLGGYFAVAALLILLIVRRREALVFAAACAAAALPTTIWLIVTTGNPVFPFAQSLFGTSVWAMANPPLVSNDGPVIDMLRLLWDVTFARERTGQQPPMTPLLIAIALLIFAAALRDWRARTIAIISVVYIAIFAFLPRDSRYLVPLLPLVCVCAAVIAARRWPRWTMIATIVAAAPGIAYLAWRLVAMGLPPSTLEAREAELDTRIAGYRALTRAGDARVYVCGAEQLQYFAKGSLLGDFNGQHSFERVLHGADDTATLAERLRSRAVDYYLVVKSQCRARTMNGGLELAYEDDRAQLWRVQGRAPR